MPMIFLATGNCHLGRVDRDKDGNVIKNTPPHFEHCDDGGSVIVGKLNPDTMEQIDSADAFGDYQASAYLKKALALLNPNRAVDVPNFKQIIRSAINDGVDICDYCSDMNCSNCIVSEWKEEAEQE